MGNRDVSCHEPLATLSLRRSIFFPTLTPALAGTCHAGPSAISGAQRGDCRFWYLVML